MVVLNSKIAPEQEEELIQPPANTIHVGGKPKSISFSGCGFLGLYHIGVASCLKQHAPKLVKSFDRIYGCSAGSIIGAMLLTDVCFGEVCCRTMKIVTEIRSRYLGALSPGFRLSETLMQDLRAGLPEDAHIRASGKLFISLTRVCDGKNVIVSDYKSRDELIQVLICSSFVPFYSGIFPPKYRGVRYVDGGLSNNLPADDDTITVSPWSGNSDICPRNDASTSLLDLSFVNTSIQLNESNLYRVWSMFLPKNPKELKDFCSQGFRETVQYLCDHGLFETVHPRRRNLTFSSQLNKLDERKKITRRLSVTANKILLQVPEEEDVERRSSFSSTYTSDSSQGIDVFLGDLDEDPLEECFDENDNHTVMKDPLPTEVQDGDTTESKSVFTVIHAYPVNNDSVLKLEFHLPPVVLDALENAFEHDRLVTRLPWVRLLYDFRDSFAVQIPLDKSYRAACIVLNRAESIPSDLHWLSDHLRRLVDKLHQTFQSSGQALVSKLQNANQVTIEKVQLLGNRINVTLQMLVELMVKRSVVLGSWIVPLLRSKILTKTLPSITLNGSKLLLQAC